MDHVKVNNLSYSYDGEHDAVSNVSFNIEKGSYTTIIGHNGSGKSTIAKLLVGLLEKKNGTIMIEDLELNQDNLIKIRNKIGIVFQNPDNQFIGSTVRDDIAFGLENHCVEQKDMDPIINEYAAKVNMTDFLDSEPTHLSGGQKQRVAIARALANNPKILLSDEATSALDPEATESILDLLKKLNKKLGITIVIITHEMSVIKTICHKVAVMENGSVVEQGDVYDIFAYPKMQITKKFINSTSSLAKIGTLIKNDPSLANKENGRLVKLLFGKEAVGDALISDVSRKFSVDISIVLASVEVLQDAQLGAMIALIKGTKENIDDAIKYIISNNVVVSDVEIPGGATNE